MLLRGDTPRIKIRGMYRIYLILLWHHFSYPDLWRGSHEAELFYIGFSSGELCSRWRDLLCKNNALQVWILNSFYKLISCSSKREPPSEDLLISILPDQKGIPIVTLKVHCKNLYLHQQTWNQIHIYIYIFKMLTNTWFTCCFFFLVQERRM